MAGSLSKISAGAPVFIGENNVDISSGTNGCHTIAWWQNGSDINSVPGVTNLTIYAIGSDSYRIYHFNFSPDISPVHTVFWYCVDSKPYYTAFTVNEPQIDIKVWDLDNNSDVTGQSVPVSSNVTYRIDTNLAAALSPLNRPNSNPADSPYTFTLTDPNGKTLTTIYTGDAGNSSAPLLIVNTNPPIPSSPYFWSQGGSMGPPGPQCPGIYHLSPWDLHVYRNPEPQRHAGQLSGQSRELFRPLSTTAKVTFVSDQTAVPSTTSPQPVPTTQPVASTTTPTFQATTVATTSPVARRRRPMRPCRRVCSRGNHRCSRGDSQEKVALFFISFNTDNSHTGEG